MGGRESQGPITPRPASVVSAKEVSNLFTTCSVREPRVARGVSRLNGSSARKRRLLHPAGGNLRRRAGHEARVACVPSTYSALSQAQSFRQAFAECS